MKGLRSISRRHFIVSCAGAAALLQSSRLAYGKSAPTESVLEKLIYSLDAQGRIDNDPITPEAIDNLTYAFNAIAPTSHTEYAFVVWAGCQYQNVASLIDEYCRRRNNEPPQMFDHPMLKLDSWCQPQTARVLVFREQLVALTKELTGRDIAFRIYQGIVNGTGPEMLHGFLTPTYKEALTNRVVEELYQYIQSMYATSREYSWCSTLVERAGIIHYSHLT